ncbi:cysteine desulfurase family protein [Dictyobacter arantiisoli]|uniref:cysteine desulfurase n=1 Tax=Dictyobacter arantiisoli TaxID=2014874 RepID=A0A5A5TFH2_9CHLR|nr:cysteine desulfurase family protein [Dictyobacter arantiisoli]GCF09749.1 cysteine desulfurase [Dictyobacter arantiisoli]
MKTHPGLRNGPIYLDYNATTPVDPAVVDALTPYLTTYFGNPSSTHAYARQTHEAMETARAQLAHLLGCIPSELVFTGCGSESNALAIRGAALANRFHGNHIITQVSEHPAVLNVCKALARFHGFRVTYLPVDKYGLVNPSEVEAALEEQTTLISIMYANNETGTIQPIGELARIAKRHGVLLHTDASQAVGKIPVDVGALGVDFLTVAGHKLYAPKGIGALYIRRGLQVEPLLYGGGQEGGLRAGTENIAFIVALGTAAVLAEEQLPSTQARLQKLRDRLQQRLEVALPHATHLNGHPTDRLPNTLNISIDGVAGEAVLAATPGIASSTGSACHAGQTDPSPVLTAMGCSRERALGALRLSLGRWSSEGEVDQAADLLAQTIHDLREKRES